MPESQVEKRLGSCATAVRFDRFVFVAWFTLTLGKSIQPGWRNLLLQRPLPDESDGEITPEFSNKIALQQRSLFATFAGLQIGPWPAVALPDVKVRRRVIANWLIRNKFKRPALPGAHVATSREEQS